MRLFKIKNKYMYVSNSKDYKPNGHHTYVVYKDKKSGKYRAIQLTHLFEKKKEILIDKGRLRVERFKQFRYPTGVPNTYYDCDVNGNALDFGRKTKFQCIGTVSSFQAKRIKDFAKRKHK